jgi:hypothetical protein
VEYRRNRNQAAGATAAATATATAAVPVPNLAIRVEAQDRVIVFVGNGFTPNQTVEIQYTIHCFDAPKNTSGELTLTSDGMGSFVHQISIPAFLVGNHMTGLSAEAIDLASNKTVEIFFGTNINL